MQSADLRRAPSSSRRKHGTPLACTLLLLTLGGCRRRGGDDGTPLLPSNADAITDSAAPIRPASHGRIAALEASTKGLVLNEQVEVSWLEDGRFAYRQQREGGVRVFVAIDPATAARTPAFDHARLASALSKELGRDIDPDRLPVTNTAWRDGALRFSLEDDDRTWAWDLATQTLQPQGDSSTVAVDGHQRLRPSSVGGVDTAITFVNRTNEPIFLWWVAADGQEHAYGTLAPGESKRQHTYSGHVWRAADAKGKTVGAYVGATEPGIAVVDGTHTSSGPQSVVAAGAVSPDGSWEVVARNHDLYRRRPGAAANRSKRLTRDGSESDGYDVSDVVWAPDSRRLVALKTTKGDDRRVFSVESSPADQLQPVLHSHEYLKPGDAIPQPRPVLIEVDSGRARPIEHAGLDNPWSISDVHWAPDSSRFMFLFNQRGHQALRIFSVDAQSASATIIVEEKSETFIDYADKFYLQYLDQTDELLWMSERDGWNHVYLIDSRDGRVKHPVTTGEWVVRGLDEVDVASRTMVFRAGGVRAEQDPYYVHYGRVSLDGGEPQWLTEADGTHRIGWSPDGRWYLDHWSRVDHPPTTELRNGHDGSFVMVVEEANWSALLATGWAPPQRFVAKGRDDATDIYGVIWRPTDHRSDATYPVVEYIYAGPQAAYTPKSFDTWRQPRSIAELGMIVVQLDGMGTSQRSKAFHDVAWKNLGDAGFPDRIAWIRAAARQDPTMDLKRVGIYGGSAGGQNALRALLAHGDFYSVAVADCGCHDNRMDKIWWNELWMGWPVDEHYAEQSNVTQAHRLEGDLMLIVGELDDNVDPSSTMQVVDALVKADKDFDLLVLPGVGHGAAETPYGQRRRADFLAQHLLGEKPAR